MIERTITIERDNFPEGDVELELPNSYMDRVIKTECDDEKVGIINDADLTDQILTLDIEIDDVWSNVPNDLLNQVLYSEITFKVTGVKDNES